MVQINLEVKSQPGITDVTKCLSVLYYAVINIMFLLVNQTVTRRRNKVRI